MLSALFGEGDCIRVIDYMFQAQAYRTLRILKGRDSICTHGAWGRCPTYVVFCSCIPALQMLLLLRAYRGI